LHSILTKIEIIWRSSGADLLVVIHLVVGKRAVLSLERRLRSTTEALRPAMRSAALLVLLLAAFAEAAPASKSATEDYPTSAVAPARDVFNWNQSQQGKFNLQVSLKDIKIFALLNSDQYDDDDNNAEVI
jgi:hypothetical protein